MDTREIIKHLQRQKQALDEALTALNGHPKMRRRISRKNISAAARKRMSIAQKRRWRARRAKAKA
jgi:hypothetical protein